MIYLIHEQMWQEYDNVVLATTNRDKAMSTYYQLVDNKKDTYKVKDIYSFRVDKNNIYVMGTRFEFDQSIELHMWEDK